MPVDFYEPFADDEDALRLLLISATIGSLGALAALQRLPYRLRRPPPPGWKRGQPRPGWVPTTRIIRRQDAGLVLASEWWLEIWKSLELAAVRRLSLISVHAASPLLRRFAARLGGFSADSAAVTAESYARELVEEIRIITADALPSGLEAVARQRTVTRELRALLAPRLGATPLQVARINRWEARALAEGKLTRKEILAEIRRRGLVAINQRANSFAGEALVRQVSEARTAVFVAAGRLVYSWNPDDKKTREEHRRQLRITRARPTPAGEPWTPEAPLRGLPPYAERCRCGVADAGPGRPARPVGFQGL